MLIGEMEMCNLLVANTIVEVLDEKIQNGEVFTAFDITSAARGKTNDKVGHNDVRNIVQNEFITQQMQGYDRELCALTISGNPQAFVYFPDTKQASDHPLVSINSTPDTTDTDDDDTDSAVDLDDDEYETTKEGRVQIPRKLLSQISANGGSYDILISGTLKCASKDARGSVRVGLRQFGIQDSKVKLTVDTLNNTINIETV